MTSPKTSFFRTKSDGYIKFDSKGKKEKFLSCERKYGFSNLLANKIIKEEAAKGNMLYTYPCKNCGKWHLTHIKQ